MIRFAASKLFAVLALASLTGSSLADDRGEAAWRQHGFTSQQREQIRESFEAGIDRKFIPGGALLILHQGEVVFREAFGVAELDSGRPFTVTTPCRIASLTKPHTSTLIALFVEEGKLDWDDPLDKHIPELAYLKIRGKGPASRSPKLSELLSHTSGFPGNAEIDRGGWEIDTDGTLADAVASLGQAGLATEPGSTFAYGGTGYIVAGRIAEVVTGDDFNQLMQERLLRPIGATTATFAPSEQVRAAMATPYERKGGEFVPITAAKRGRFGSEFPNPGGGLVSTLDDVGKLVLLHRNRGKADGKQVIAADSLRALYKPQPPIRASGYGLGFNIQKRDDAGIGTRLRHTGASGTLAEIDFERDLAVVVLTQVPQRQTMPWRTRLLRTIGDVFGGDD